MRLLKAHLRQIDAVDDVRLKQRQEAAEVEVSVLELSDQLTDLRQDGVLSEHSLQ